MKVMLAILFFPLYVYGVAGSKYLGCYREPSVYARLLSGAKRNFEGTLTNQVCINFCGSKGFHYAGTEWRKECFCSNHKPTYKSLADEDQCTVQCDGNTSEFCGGNMHISVYSLDDNLFNSVATHYIGCFADSEERLLNGAKTGSEILTAEFCVGFCYRRGFRLAGVQYAKECWCGDSIKVEAKVGKDKCDKPCSGDINQMCGGTWHISVYHTGIPDLPIDENFMGCYIDSGNKRVLSGVRYVFSGTNTQQRCMNVCLGAGYKYSGNEYSYECFCGNRKPSSNLQVSEHECHMPCPGNTKDFCGGTWRILILSTGKGNVQPIIPELAYNRPENSTTAQPSTPGTTTSPPQFTVESADSSNSETLVNGERKLSGNVVFEEDFTNQIDSLKWSHEIFMPNAPDYEFVTFADKPQNSFIKNGRLFIKPTILDDDTVRQGKIDLQNCTGIQKSEECAQKAEFTAILPPVDSARITTKNKFSFCYGIVQIVAKLPVGDWIIPEIWLQPKDEKYGKGYSSGKIRLAMARGNKNLMYGDYDLGNSQLEYGILMGIGDTVRGRTIFKENSSWHEGFHNFTLIWTPDNLSFIIDGQPEEELVPLQGGLICELAGFDESDCETWKSGSSIAPFDVEFYISLGVSVGGMRDFPDESVSGNVTKPWENMSAKAMTKFWQARDSWKETWGEEQSSLQVESIKVIAL